MSITTIHEEFINDQARRLLFRPYQPSSGLKYKNAEGLTVKHFNVPKRDPVVYMGQVKVEIKHKIDYLGTTREV
jgi:hypothetical protein